MIDQDHPHPLLRLLGMAVAGGGTAGLLHGFADRALTALIGATITAFFALLVELARPALRRQGERISERVHGPGPVPRPPPPPDAP